MRTRDSMVGDRESNDGSPLLRVDSPATPLSRALWSAWDRRLCVTALQRICPCRGV